MPDRPVEARIDMELPAAGELDRQRRGQRRAEAVDQRRHRGAEQRRDGVHAQRRTRQAELLERAAVGADELAVLAHRQDALHQRADELDPAVEVQPHDVAVVVGQPVVLDHARAHLHQAHRVLVVAALVAGDIEHAQDVAARIENGRGRAGQEVVGVHVVLVGMHERGRLLDQRGTDRIGALGLLRPVHAGLQRDLGGAVQEVLIADRVQDRAGGIAQQHHRLAVDDLLVEHLHHRRGMRVQTLVALAHHAQVGSPQRRIVQPLDARQPEGGAALVRLVDLVHMLVVERQRRGDRAPRIAAAAGAHAQPSGCRGIGTCHAVS